MTDTPGASAAGAVWIMRDVVIETATARARSAGIDPAKPAPDTIELTDPQVLGLFRNGDTAGVFQFERTSTQTLLRRLRPETFDDVVLFHALSLPPTLELLEQAPPGVDSLRRLEHMVDAVAKARSSRHTRRAFEAAHLKVYYPQAFWLSLTEAEAQYALIDAEAQ
jgi:hypothetical protein